MPIRLDSRSADFAARFAQFLATKREVSADVDAAVRGIVADVAARGDEALIELSRKFDRVDLGKLGLRVTATEIAAAETDRDRIVFRQARDGRKHLAEAVNRFA